MELHCNMEYMTDREVHIIVNINLTNNIRKIISTESQNNVRSRKE